MLSEPATAKVDFLQEKVRFPSRLPFLLAASRLSTNCLTCFGFCRGILLIGDLASDSLFKPLVSWEADMNTSEQMLGAERRSKTMRREVLEEPEYRLLSINLDLYDLKR